jgi:hypothetical protein
MNKRTFASKLSLSKETLQTLSTTDTAQVDGGFLPHQHPTMGQVASCYNHLWHLSCAGLSDCIC